MSEDARNHEEHIVTVRNPSAWVMQIIKDLEVTRKMYTATVPSGTILDAIFKKSADRAGTNIDLDSGHSRVNEFENYWNYVPKPANTVKWKSECPWSDEWCGVSCLRCFAGWL